MQPKLYIVALYEKAPLRANLQVEPATQCRHNSLMTEAGVVQQKFLLCQGLDISKQAFK